MVFLYCLSNESMIDIFKIGITSISPFRHAEEMSGVSVPMPFVVDFYIEFDQNDTIIQIIYDFFESLNLRVTPKKDFFKNINVIKQLFNIIAISASTYVIYPGDEELPSIDSKYCIDLKKSFIDGEKLRHIIVKKNKINSIYEFTYNLSKKIFKYGDDEYSTMNEITKLHYKNVILNKPPINGAWVECEIFRDHWIPLLDLKPPSKIEGGFEL